MKSAFLNAFKSQKPIERRTILQDMMVALVKTVGEKMKGFSRKETLVYYEEIINKAFKQVEDAQTPEVKAEKYSEAVDWTMLDKDYDQRTRRTFGTGPVFMPSWWYRADPTIRGTIAGKIGSGSMPQMPSGGKSQTITLPSLPGSDAAASVVNTVTAFSTGAVGNVASFTGAVTAKTNPVPVATSSTFRGSGQERRRFLQRVRMRLCLRRVRLCLRRRRSVNSSTMPDLFSLTKHKASGESKPLAWGIYHYLRESGDSKKRIHLRVETDGSGVMIINASRMYHFNPSAALMARMLLDEKPDAEILKQLGVVFDVKRAQAESDYQDFQDLI